MAQCPTLTRERRLLAHGFRYIAGLDEAGRGAWAGPVVAATVILPLRGKIEAGPPEEFRGIRDSKLLSPHRREELFDVIRERARMVGVGVVGPRGIDAQGIVPATRQAMQTALARLEVAPDYLLIDYLPLPEVDVPQKAIAHGDRLCLSIAAASIIAKVHRDRLMVEFDGRFPGYGFAQHKGYGTPAHRRALSQLGPSPIHRLSWAPCRRLT
ncbi:MAG: ribonuclease HII [Chloroflexota bacterium]|nr:ribonuclease HII [Chloroflexota bacterium]